MFRDVNGVLRYEKHEADTILALMPRSGNKQRRSIYTKPSQAARRIKRSEFKPEQFIDLIERAISHLASDHPEKLYNYYQRPLSWVKVLTNIEKHSRQLKTFLDEWYNSAPEEKLFLCSFSDYPTDDSLLGIDERQFLGVLEWVRHSAKYRREVAEYLGKEKEYRPSNARKGARDLGLFGLLLHYQNAGGVLSHNKSNGAPGGPCIAFLLACLGPAAEFGIGAAKNVSPKSLAALIDRARNGDLPLIGGMLAPEEHRTKS